MALGEGNPELQSAVTRPEDNMPTKAVAVGHFVQVALRPEIRCNALARKGLAKSLTTSECESTRASRSTRTDRTDDLR